MSVCYSVPSLLIWVFLFAVSLERRIHPLSQELHLTGVGQTLGIFRWKQTTFTIIISIQEWNTYYMFLFTTFLQFSRLGSVYFCFVSIIYIFHTTFNLSPVCVPGLKRMMARRQPSSVLSICMSLILLTSSVKTLQRGEEICRWQSQLETGSQCQIREERRSKKRMGERGDKKKREQESNKKNKEKGRE